MFFSIYSRFIFEFYGYLFTGGRVVYIRSTGEEVRFSEGGNFLEESSK